jgi:hypothetical protein
MNCELLTVNFTQTPLYLEVVKLVNDCNCLASPRSGGVAMTLQGRKLFAGKIRQELSGLLQSLFRAASTNKAHHRRRPLENANVHFKTLCKFLQACYDLHFLHDQYYHKISVQTEKVRAALWLYNLD